MRRGVTMWDPERTYVDAEAELEADVSLLPGVILRGACRDRAPAPRSGPTACSPRPPWARVPWSRPACAPGRPSATAHGWVPTACSRPGPKWRPAQRCRPTRSSRAPGSNPARNGAVALRPVELIPRRRLELVSGRAHPTLAQDIAGHLGVELGQANLREFANGEIYCKYDISIRGCDVFIIQTHASPVNDSLMEQLIMIDAAKRASAKRITAVCPYYGYSRQDRKSTGREPITAKLVADMLSAAGADRVVSRRPALRSDPGLLRHPVRPPRGGAGARGVHEGALRRRRRRGGARRRAGEGGRALQPAPRLRPGPDPQDAAARHLQRGARPATSSATSRAATACSSTT